VDDIERMELVWQMNEIHMTDGPYFLGTVANTPRIIIVSKNLTNVPMREQLKLGGFCNPWIIPYPAVTTPRRTASPTSRIRELKFALPNLEEGSYPLLPNTKI